jgi:hypothetical protein
MTLKHKLIIYFIYLLIYLDRNQIQIIDVLIYYKLIS